MRASEVFFQGAAGHPVRLKDVGATSVKVDEIGIGCGVADTGKRDGLPFIGVNDGEKAHDPERFVNRRTEKDVGIAGQYLIIPSLGP